MPLHRGSRLGSYEILSALGTGGMGAVYLARDTRLTRNVAIKILHREDGATLESNTRLLREARATARLDHPNICAIYEVGQADGRAFIVMQLVEGETLQARLERGPLDPIDAATLGAEIADALGFAHAQGIVHRDVTPANIMITRDGHAKVMDFGIAMSAPVGSAAAVETRTATEIRDATIVGSLPYMSPEQLRNEPVDGRSDAFSLGVVLYEMVTGRRPFDQGSTAATISAILTLEPQPASDRRIGLPAEFERIIHKALAKHPDERFQSLRDLSVDLRRLRDPHARAAPPSRRTRRRATVLAASALVVAALAGWGVYRQQGRPAPIRSMAVMPFVNTANDPDIDYLADGITDQIIDRLSQLPDLRVMSHNAVFHYKGHEVGPGVIGKELGVEAVLLGRLTRRSGAVAIQLELVGAADQRHIWGEQYSRPVAEIAALGGEVPAEISAKLRPELTRTSAARIARIDTGSAEAYQLYLKGRNAWEKWTPAGAAQAIAFFQRAIAIDPDYALAYAGIADAYMIGTGPADVTRADGLARAREAATRALSLDSRLAEPHAALAGVLLADWKFTEADQEYRRAIALNPSCAECYHEYSHLLLFLGRIDDSLIQSRKFLDVDPVSQTPIEHLGYHYLRARRFADAIAQYTEERRLYPEATQDGDLGNAYYFAGRYREAVDEDLRFLRSSGAASDGEIARLRTAFATSGIAGYLRARIDHLKASPDTPDARFAIASYYARLGERDRAFELLDGLFAEHSSTLVALKENPSFDALHADPRFTALLRRVGLPA